MTARDAVFGRFLVSREDCSVVEVLCAPADYSASALARAVEDADVHLVDLVTLPADGGKVSVTLRVRCGDPTSVCHHLERYGYEVSASYPAEASVPALLPDRLQYLLMSYEL